MTARVLLALTLAVTATAAPAQATWKPDRNVEIVVGVSAGGGTIAFAYLNQRQGDAHVWEITATSLLTNHITGKSAIGHKDFTPVAMLYDEYIGFLVRQDSPLKSGRDLLNALKANPGSLPIGIATAAGNTNHIAAGLAARAAGAEVKKLRVVVFGSGGESMTALLGGHIAVVATPSANAIPHLQAGRMRVLAIAAPVRLEGALAAIPTWKEQGENIIVANWRPVVGPKGWSAAQVGYWEAVFARLVATDEWKNEVARAGGVNHYMNSRELAAYFDSQYAQFKAALTELGLAKLP